jgi:galactose mutarotase-like enzyme
MNTFQIQAHLPGKGLVDVLASPSIAEAQKLLNGGPGDLHGNQSFMLGGAILAPFAGRVRGTVAPDGKTFSVDIKGHKAVLPANWSGRRPGAEKHAIHGLILDRQATEVKTEADAAGASITGILKAGDFGVGWPSQITITTRVALAEDSIEVRVTALNEGGQLTVVGFGWHPYFAFPSGDRNQVRLRIPAAERLEVNNRDEHFPTGRLLPVAGTEYDLSAPGGGAIAGLSLEECFTNLKRDHEGHAVAEISDPSAKFGLRIAMLSPEISAIQVYAPADQQYAAIEPWFNLPDPFGTVWNTAAGMVELRPGASTTYAVRLKLFTA